MSHDDELERLRQEKHTLREGLKQAFFGFALKLPQEVARTLFIPMHAPAVHCQNEKRKGNGLWAVFSEDFSVVWALDSS